MLKCIISSLIFFLSKLNNEVYIIMLIKDLYAVCYVTKDGDE